ncbi:MAG: Stealth CR1 domain-containing protein [Ruminococcus sp.]|nr:Stealth CR1 domain-containing protein [Ruminococcus sp.]
MKKNTKQQGKIDFVLLWVDGSDPEWQKIKSEYSHTSNDDDRPQRYRDLGFLRYWFRGVELFAPWVGNIYFVTWGHLPEWLNTDHPKLRIVNHADYMPAEYLPTFSSHPLELNLFRIKGLSEQFVYFNDDVFLINHTKPEDFFKDGKPVDMLALQPDVANPIFPVMSYIHINNALLISRHFDKRTQMKRFKSKFFHIGYPVEHFGYNLIETVFPRYTGFYTVHGPSPLLKSTCETIWSKEKELLDEVSRHKFRSSGDVSQFIFREWQKQSGEFVPANLHRKFRYFEVGRNMEKALHIIRKQKRRMICLNDPDKEIDFEADKETLSKALAEIMPEPSSFEKY